MLFVDHQKKKKVGWSVHLLPEQSLTLLSNVAREHEQGTKKTKAATTVKGRSGASAC